MYGLTFLGDPVMLMLLAGVITFAVSRDLGVKMTLALVAAILTYSSIKMFIGDPRPYQLDPDIGIVTAMGFGFPSGHTAVATVFWAGMALWSAVGRRTTVWVVAIAAIVIVGTTRMYLGVHFPADVLGGLVVGIIVLVLVGWITRLGESHGWPQTSTDRSAVRLVIIGASILAILSILLSADLKTALIMGLPAGILLGLTMARPGGDDSHSYLMDGRSVMKRLTTGIGVILLLGSVAVAGTLLGGVIGMTVPTFAGIFGGLWLTLLAPRAFRVMGLSSRNRLQEVTQ